MPTVHFASRKWLKRKGLELKWNPIVGARPTEKKRKKWKKRKKNHGEEKEADDDDPRLTTEKPLGYEQSAKASLKPMAGDVSQHNHIADETVQSRPRLLCDAKDGAQQSLKPAATAVGESQSKLDQEQIDENLLDGQAPTFTRKCERGLFSWWREGLNISSQENPGR